MTKLNNIIKKFFLLVLTMGVLMGAGFPAGKVSATAPYLPGLTTSPAYYVTNTGATLSASVDPGGYPVKVWFEYGTNQSSLSNTTSYENISNLNGVSYVYKELTNLSSNTDYYFRAVAQNDYGTKRGSIVTFRTTNDSSNSGNNGYLPGLTTSPAYNIDNNSATLSASVDPGSYSTDVWFEWGTSQSLGYTTSNENVSGTGVKYVYKDISGLSSNTDYYFRAVARNNYGTKYGSIVNFRTSSYYNNNDNNYYPYPDNNYYPYQNNGSAPSVTTNSAGSITSNSASLFATLNTNNCQSNIWFEYGPTQSLGYTTSYQTFTAGNNNVNVTGYLYNLTPGTTFYYRAVAQNTYGTRYGQILSFATTGTGYIPGSGYGNGPIVTTSPATGIFKNTGILNGTVNSNGVLTNAWFEWGTNQSLGNRTVSQAVGSNSNVTPIAFVLSGLNSNTTYYFRAVAQNSYGTSYGQVLSFVTRSTTYTGTETERVIVKRVVVTATEEAPASIVTLTPSIDNEKPLPGDELTYTLVYKNESSAKLTNAMVNIVLPSEVKVIASSPLATSLNSNNMTFGIGTIGAKTQGVITIKVRVVDDVKAGDALVFSSILNFVDSKKNFQTVNAFLTVVVGGDEAVLGASMNDVWGRFFGNWLVDLILGLILGFLIYHFFVRRRGVNNEMGLAEDVIK